MTEKELRTLDEMLTNLEIWSTWNKTFANEMIGICSKMRNLLSDRKTENSSEKPNNCETCKYDTKWWDEEPCDMCSRGEHNYYEPKDEPQTDCDHKCIQTEIGCERTDCPRK